MQISLEQMHSTLLKLFLNYGFADAKATLLARTFSESTLDGVNSHGINRVPLFIKYIREGIINIDAEAQLAGAFGLMERWDGHGGPGIVNATKCTTRALELAKNHGIGLVALRNTNHWMRAGSYGWQAAEAGCMAIMFTNTTPNMPAWGGKESRLGNNPLVIAIPRDGGHVVLDMAMSQYAFGKLNEYKLAGKKLPFAGGWDQHDQLTRDPEQIISTMRGLPIGFWKGSALSMVLDMLAAVLSAGESTSSIADKQMETGVSQVFICIDNARFGDGSIRESVLRDIIEYTHRSTPIAPGMRTYYPGEKTRITRQKNLKEGMMVDDGIWEKVTALAGD
ncbi:MAG: 3-dehydro-L-gulonate 2-dehydrogenase [Cyclobacteriaceae bacterium]|nr:3-dehydro-L-gulonate 2-dehydrogenase [Cyclobacteriaceae bacterium]